MNWSSQKYIFSGIDFTDTLRFSSYLDHFSIYYIKSLHFVTLCDLVTAFFWRPKVSLNQECIVHILINFDQLSWKFQNLNATISRQKKLLKSNLSCLGTDRLNISSNSINFLLERKENAPQTSTLVQTKDPCTCYCKLLL